MPNAGTNPGPFFSLRMKPGTEFILRLPNEDGDVLAALYQVRDCIELAEGVHRVGAELIRVQAVNRAAVLQQAQANRTAGDLRPELGQRDLPRKETDTRSA